MSGNGDEKKQKPVKKILILAANPKDTDRLRFDEEVSIIKECIKRSEFREKIEIYSELAVNYSKIRKALLDYKPNIVHFIGHGNKDGVTGDDKNGFADFISSEALSELLEEFLSHLKCVILNACYSALYANDINKHIDYVIGIQKKIKDQVAIAFSDGFYDGLGAGKSVKKCFTLGHKAAKQLANEDLFHLFKKKKRLKKTNKVIKTDEEDSQRPVSLEESTGCEEDAKNEISKITAKVTAETDGRDPKTPVTPITKVNSGEVGTEREKRTNKISFTKKLLIAICFLVLFLILDTFFFHLLIKLSDFQSSPIERVKIKDNSLSAFDTEGKYWEKIFHSNINRSVVADIDKDKENDILVGFSAEGNEGGRVIALDSKRNVKWRFFYNPPYPGAAKVKWAVSDMKMFDENQEKIIAVLLRDEGWDISALVILNSNGIMVKELWHHGFMQQIEKIKKTYIIRAVNNDLRQTTMPRHFRGNFSIIFGIKYENICGEVPPYLGMVEKNSNLEWYFFLSDQDVKFKKLMIRGKIIFAPTTCGKQFNFEEQGLSSFTKGHSCKDSLRLVKLEITKKENGDVRLSTPGFKPITGKSTKKIIRVEANLSKELRDKGLIKMVREASAYCEAGNFDGENKALTLYRKVIEELSPGARRTSTLLIDADNNFRDKHWVHALRKYKVLFDKAVETKPKPSPKNIGYLTVDGKSGIPEVKFYKKGNKVCLTSETWNSSVFWIKFKNYGITWKNYDKIYLKVDYSEQTDFDQSAMLKLELNDTILSTVNRSVRQVGNDFYLIQSKGNFYYLLEPKYLDKDNEITLTLNKGKWKDFCIELALIKKK